MASTAEEFRKATQLEVTLTNGLVVTIGRRDIISMFLEGHFQFPLLTAMQRLIKTAPTFMDDPMNMQKMTPEEKEAVIATMRHFVVAVVISPKFVMEEPGEDSGDTVSAKRLPLADLLLIWAKANEFLKGSAVDRLTADRFRGRSPRPDDPDPPSGEVIRDTPVEVPAPGPDPAEPGRSDVADIKYG